ncbi:hypothetical protein [Micromonospora pallida]|uniref:hypothetical protein n=1 Tax=Micromonospora pallida TaxID=145854 RepID=UPI000B826B24|nr:hypothetical protein [Micromonospora pallida]
MTKRGVLFAVGGGLAAAGAAAGFTAIQVSEGGIYLLGYVVMIVGGLMIAKARRLGLPARRR